MKFLLTNAGKEMESKLVAGGKPIITRIESGDTYSANPESLQSVINKKQLLQVDSIDVIEGKTCITFILTNVELSEDYWIRQIGIYAKQNEAADEILYLIGQDATGELIPAPVHRIVEYIYKLNLAIDNAYDMKFVANSTDFVRKKQFEELEGKKLDASGGDISDTKVGALEASEESYPVFKENDTIKVIFGKIKKFFTDMRDPDVGVCYISQLVHDAFTNNKKLAASAAAVYRMNHDTPLSVPKAGWSSGAAPYTQTITVKGVTSKDNPLIGLSIPSNATADTVKAQSKAWDCVDRAVTGTDKITFYCYRKRPEVDFEVRAKGV